MTTRGAGAFEYEVLFAEQGRTPHQARALEAPVDYPGSGISAGDRVLFMCDPHSTREAFVYDRETGAVEWRAAVPGDTVPNPHQGGILRRDVGGLGEVGDVYCFDRDNRLVVFDPAGEVRSRRAVAASFEPEWLHCVRLVDDRLVATDYDADRVVAIDPASMETVWEREVCRRPSSVTAIANSSKSGFHAPDFGGDLLVASNTEGDGGAGVVVELTLSGEVAWRSTEGMDPLVQGPHAAFRMGRCEGDGNVTVTASEVDGGLYGVARDGHPVFGVGGVVTKNNPYDQPYNWTSDGLGEITHVFPTHDGRIGFVSWSGVDRSVVAAVDRLPDRQHVAFEYDAGEATAELTYGNAIPLASWDRAEVLVVNEGARDLSYEVVSSLSPHVDHDSLPGRAAAVDDGVVPAGERATHSVESPYQAFAVGTAGEGSYRVLAGLDRG